MFQYHQLTKEEKKTIEDHRLLALERLRQHSSNHEKLGFFSTDVLVEEGGMNDFFFGVLCEFCGEHCLSFFIARTALSQIRGVVQFYATSVEQFVEKLRQHFLLRLAGNGVTAEKLYARPLFSVPV